MVKSINWRANKMINIFKNKALPSFENNEINNWFGHYIPEDGLVDAIDAYIFYNWKIIRGCTRIKDVTVIYVPKRKMRELSLKSHPVWGRLFAYKRQYYTSDVGNCFSTWMEEDDRGELGKIQPPYRIDSTSTELFEWFLEAGFETHEEAERAVNEFKHIKECAWARDPNLNINAMVKPYTEEEYDHTQQRQEKYEYNQRIFKAAVEKEIVEGRLIEPKIIRKNLDREFYEACMPESPETIEYYEYEAKVEAIKECIFEGNITESEEKILLEFADGLDAKEELYNKTISEMTASGEIKVPTSRLRRQKEGREYIPIGELNSAEERKYQAELKRIRKSIFRPQTQQNTSTNQSVNIEEVL